MSDYYIQLRGGVNEKLYNQIQNLQGICESYHETNLKLELDYKLAKYKTDGCNMIQKINEFTYWDEQTLIGYIGINDFGGRVIEVNGMVHPEYRRKGIFKKLFSLVVDEWSKRDIDTMLLLTDKRSIEGKEFINSRNAIYDHCEYEMVLCNSKYESLKNTMMEMYLRDANSEDVLEIARQNSIYFGEELKDQTLIDVEEEKNRGFYIYMAELNGVIIGKVHLHIMEGKGGIFGLGILPVYRGKGYGRELLLCSVEKLMELGTNHIFLQVDAENDTALGLYTSCGFDEIYSMEYYKLTKGK